MEVIKATSDTVACTLTADEHDQVRAAWQALFRSALITRQDVASGIRLTFAPAAKKELKRLIEIESELQLGAVRSRRPDRDHDR